jgi:regulator of sigma E protease
MKEIIGIILGLVAFGIIVWFHELGHFLLAKREGVAVKEFAVGMGPKLKGFKRKGTEYTIRLLPLGGYVSFADDEEYRKTSLGARARILIAGPFFNFILGYVLFVSAALIKGNDLFFALKKSFFVMIQASTLIFHGIIGLFTSKEALSQLSGPVGIVHQTSQIVPPLVHEPTQAVIQGIAIFLLWTALLSINLGIMNLIPIPVLDGGRLLLLGLEKLKIFKMTEKKEVVIMAIGAVIILAVFVIGLWNDITNIVTKVIS